MKSSTALVFLGAATLPFVIHEAQAKAADGAVDRQGRPLAPPSIDPQKVAAGLGLLSGAYWLLTRSPTAGVLALGSAAAVGLIVARDKQVF